MRKRRSVLAKLRAYGCRHGLFVDRALNIFAVGVRVPAHVGTIGAFQDVFVALGYVVLPQ